MAGRVSGQETVVLITDSNEKCPELVTASRWSAAARVTGRMSFNIFGTSKVLAGGISTTSSPCPPDPEMTLKLAERPFRDPTGPPASRAFLSRDSALCVYGRYRKVGGLARILVVEDERNIADAVQRGGVREAAVGASHQPSSAEESLDVR